MTVEGKPFKDFLDAKNHVEAIEYLYEIISNQPLEQLRGRFEELPKNQEIWLVCGVGQRAYYAARML